MDKREVPRQNQRVDTTQGHGEGRAILTIGYGNRTPESFLELLLLHHTGLLVDVRSAPYSRTRPEFSGDSLRVQLPAQGIEYTFMGHSLGGQPDDPECFVNGRVDYVRCRRQAWFQTGVDELQSMYDNPPQLVLMCAELRPEQCHRSKLIGEELTARGIRVLHIDESGTEVPHVKVIERLSRGQLELFGSPTSSTMSRKRYHR
ncbi:MAG: DUF488 domain-containing protein [Phycisphaerae bacterium]|jgi:uncharacterized protein (DUF488 family)